MRVCYTGGGTLGHVLPALSVHAVLKEREAYACLFVGSRKQSDRDAVEKEGIPYVAIFSGKLRRYFSFRTFFSLFGVLFGFLQSLWVLLRFKPDVLFSKGGYVSVPPVVAAHLLHVPLVIHESDATPGLANKIASRFARRICVPFPEAGRFFPPQKVVVTGNPIRPNLMHPSQADVKKSFGICGPLLLVLGGSQGAKEINSLIWDHLDALSSFCTIWHQCGSRDWKMVRHEKYHQCRFIGEDMASLYEGCDLVLSRSGAGTLAEICHYGKPSILIPLSRGSRGDQVVNARRMETSGASLVFRSGMDLVKMVRTLLTDGKTLEAMGRSALSLDVKDAARRISRVVEEVGGAV